MKILYQMDVGKVTLAEAMEAALERLRLEFVHRGSRTASGSPAEQVCLDAVTASLKDILPTMRLPMERAIVGVIGRIFEEAPYWQELRVEKAFKTAARGIPLSPPRLLIPVAMDYIVPGEAKPGEGPASPVSGLDDSERARLEAFAFQIREDLPRLLEPDMRKAARLFAKDIAANRPVGVSTFELQAYVHERRSALNAENAARWARVSAMVQKQTGDWLRVAAFTVKLVTGTHEKRKEIDRSVAALSSGWKLERQVSVDRNILRLAAFEMLCLPAIPTSATINEAVELAKKYSTAESGRFVNGVLGAIALEVGVRIAPGTPAATAAEGIEQDDLVDIPDIAEIEDLDLEEVEPADTEESELDAAETDYSL